jgi:hypothetical protein
MFTSSEPIILAPEQRAELEATIRSTKMRAGLARRAQFIVAWLEFPIPCRSGARIHVEGVQPRNGRHRSDGVADVAFQDP